MRLVVRKRGWEILKRCVVSEMPWDLEVIVGFEALA